MSSFDVNAGSLVLFKRFGCPVDSAAHRSRRWELGRIVNTFFTRPNGQVVEITEDNYRVAHHFEVWVTISPEKPEGPMAPTTLTVPLDVDHVDPIVHGSELPHA